MRLRAAGVLAMLIALIWPLGALAAEDAAVAADARVLLARSVRAAGIDPREIAIRSVRIRGDQAEVDWSARARAGTLTLQRLGPRWAIETPGSASASVAPVTILRAGGALAPQSVQTGGYQFVFTYGANDAPPGSAFTYVYGRVPTSAEFLPYPTVYPISSDAVFYFDLTAGAAVHFEAGSSLDVWFPFVLDDRLRYDLFIDGTAPAIGPIASRVFDNTVHFTLPAFSLPAGKTITGEIDGDPHEHL